MLEHMQYSEGLGGIFPGIMYSIMAMDALGYEREQPDFVRALRQIEGLVLDHEERHPGSAS
jgi:squalene-hopene/tetraprenyl-beta-curcumene cyclase